jgi:hypothetical protein
MSPIKSTDDVVKLNLRLPKAVHREVRQAAKANKVSLNTEIINRIKGGPQFGPDQVKNIIQTVATATAERTMQIVSTETGKRGLP